MVTVAQLNLYSMMVCEVVPAQRPRSPITVMNCNCVSVLYCTIALVVIAAPARLRPLLRKICIGRS